MTFCGNCLQNTLEGKPDYQGIWHYRCQYCVDHQDPHYIFKDTIPCPKCGCTAHENILGQYKFTNEGITKARKDAANILRPEITMYRCLNCSHEWINPDFERYVVTRAIKEMHVPTEIRR